MVNTTTRFTISRVAEIIASMARGATVAVAPAALVDEAALTPAAQLHHVLLSPERNKLAVGTGA